MNYKKAIKDLKEFNSQLKGQYSDEQNRSYCLQCKVDKLEKEKQELIEYLKERKSFYNKQYEYSTQQDDLKMYNRLINDYQKILDKIEKR